MATVNAYIYIPWMACPADNLIDWNIKENYEKALSSIKEWNNKIMTSKIQRMIDYHPRTNALSSWMDVIHFN